MQLGSYTATRKLGEGAFGRTFYGTHTLLGYPVCIKQEKVGHRHVRDLFRREATVLAKLHHVSLPCLRDYLELPDLGAVIVLSYADGPDLGHFVHTEGALDDEHVMWILLRVLDALDYLHYQGAVHCDIKPQNIILEAEAHNAILVDFGLVALAPQGTTVAMGGTKDFLPPEFATGLPPIPASDLYSIGKTAIALLGGDPGSGVIPHDVHPEFAQLLRTLVLYDPMARSQTAREVGNTIARLRPKLFGRSTTRECLKLRSGRILP